jgi:hypothetical protein
MQDYGTINLGKKTADSHQEGEPPTGNDHQIQARYVPCQEAGRASVHYTEMTAMISTQVGQCMLGHVQVVLAKPGIRTAYINIFSDNL